MSDWHITVETQTVMEDGRLLESNYHSGHETMQVIGHLTHVSECPDYPYANATYSTTEAALAEVEASAASEEHDGRRVEWCLESKAFIAWVPTNDPFADMPW
jgi:hypothetical protein